MGKAAKNEGIKLRATFYNNIAIGLTLAGFFIPLLSAYTMENFQPLVDWSNGGPPPDSRHVGHFLVACGVILLALFLARLNRRSAKRIIAGIED